ncbi:uncharacterized protein BT62DRAFT_207346 [Guyanagaster necrorhizus]|uniref:Uncharacterized protein n=1 Tax=Guyanagaster necrorhizus TaxID=856835 RepID=A0A9P7VQX2_9AGAR|nr:uncharacterized protein BT62DRAFT_207346 [Guyanagaster necrorhizus MCA 3950]KAG7445060.1 hypothetical protein BT62DRAFT_207346 [Guyanagaster necrorhizus MCA 3950]
MKVGMKKRHLAPMSLMNQHQPRLGTETQTAPAIPLHGRAELCISVSTEIVTISRVTQRPAKTLPTLGIRLYDGHFQHIKLLSYNPRKFHQISRTDAQNLSIESSYYRIVQGYQ